MTGGAITLSKKLRNILIVISCVLVVAAAVGVCIYYREEIKEFFLGILNKFRKKEEEEPLPYTEEEFEDFADI